MICLHEHQNELEKLQKAALLIEEMSMGRLKVCPSTVGHVYIRPESDAYIGLQMPSIFSTTWMTGLPLLCSSPPPDFCTTWEISSGSRNRLRDPAGCGLLLTVNCCKKSEKRKRLGVTSGMTMSRP